MAKKVLKTRTQFTSTLRNELYEALKELSDQSKVPISKLLDEAVEALLEVRQERRK
jgi:predicted DNA-binding protein